MESAKHGNILDTRRVAVSYLAYSSHTRLSRRGRDTWVEHNRPNCQPLRLVPVGITVKTWPSTFATERVITLVIFTVVVNVGTVPCLRRWTMS